MTRMRPISPVVYLTVLLLIDAFAFPPIARAENRAVICIICHTAIWRNANSSNALLTLPRISHLVTTGLDPVVHADAPHS
jgi:hypothetical protein